MSLDNTTDIQNHSFAGTHEYKYSTYNYSGDHVSGDPYAMDMLSSLDAGIGSGNDDDHDDDDDEDSIDSMISSSTSSLRKHNQSSGARSSRRGSLTKSTDDDNANNGELLVVQLPLQPVAPLQIQFNIYAHSRAANHRAQEIQAILKKARHRTKVWAIFVCL